MSKLALTLIAAMFAVSAFAADAVTAHTATPVAAPAQVVAPIVKKASKVKHHKSSAAKAVKPAAKASAPVAAAK